MRSVHWSALSDDTHEVKGETMTETSSVVEKTTNDAATPLKLDAAVIGAGVTRLYRLHLLREQGMNVKAFDTASGVGGTWYWNRYPARVRTRKRLTSTNTYFRRASTRLELEREVPGQPEIERWAFWVADKLDLRRDVKTRIKRVLRRGVRALDPDDRRRPEDRHAIPGHLFAGVSSAPLTDQFPGRDGSRATTVRPHVPKDAVDLSGKRVGVVGNGATGIMQTVANQAGHLTVFVRTPQYVLPMKNPKYTPANQEAYEGRFEDSPKPCRTLSRGSNTTSTSGDDLTPGQRRKVLEDISTRMAHSSCGSRPLGRCSSMWT